jgi:hypothetical protein
LIVGVIGVLVSLAQLAAMVAPSTPQALWLAANFPAFRQVTILVNAAGALLYGAMLYGAWRLRRGDPRGAPTIRNVSLGILAAVAVWFLVSYSQFSGAQARPRFASPGDRAALLQGTMGAAFVGLVPAAFVFVLFRHARKRPER